MKRLFMWFVLLNKRLYKKITYIGIMVLIPLLVILFSVAAKEPSGVVTIILAREDPQDALASEIIEQLISESIAVAFREDTPENAIELVSAGKADAAWIFPGNLAAHIEAFAAGKDDSAGYIRVVEREQTVALRLAREKLSGAVYQHAVKSIYLQYVRENAPEAALVSDQELMSYYENANVTGELFEFYDIYGNRRGETANYLTSPLRGMLAVLAAVGAIVTAMYYQKDLDRGIFSLLPERHRIFSELGYQMISAVNILTVALIALLAAGLGVSVWLELLLLVLYGLCCSLFGMTLRTIFGGGRGLAVLIPVLTVVMLAVCPVFFDFASVRALQFLLPPTYYVSGAYNHKYLLYLMLYNCVLALICFAGKGLKAKMIRR